MFFCEQHWTLAASSFTEALANTATFQVSIKKCQKLTVWLSCLNRIASMKHSLFENWMLKNSKITFWFSCKTCHLRGLITVVHLSHGSLLGGGKTGYQVTSVPLPVGIPFHAQALRIYAYHLPTRPYIWLTKTLAISRGKTKNGRLKNGGCLFSHK